MFNTKPGDEIVGVAWGTYRMLALSVDGWQENSAGVGGGIAELGLIVTFSVLPEIVPSDDAIRIPIGSIPVVMPPTGEMFNYYDVWGIDAYNRVESNVVTPDNTAAGWYVQTKFGVDYSQMPVPLPGTPFGSEGLARDWARNLPPLNPGYPIGGYGEEDFTYAEVTAGNPFQANHRDSGGKLYLPFDKLVAQYGDPKPPYIEFRIDAKNVNRVTYFVEGYKGPLQGLEQIEELEVEAGIYLNALEQKVYRPTRITFRVDTKTMVITSDGLPPIDAE